MAAVWLCFRGEARRRWRSWFGLATLAGVVSGAAVALAAGAVRTSSVYDRFFDEFRGYDAVVVNEPSFVTAVLDLREVAQLPMVASAERAKFGYVELGTFVGYVAPVRATSQPRVARIKLLEGRAPRSDRADEVAIPFLLAERFDVHVGDRVTLFDPEELAGAAGEYPVAARILDAVPDARFRVVGVKAAPNELPPQRLEDLFVNLTPAFARAVAEQPEEILAVRFKGGRSDFGAFARALRERSGGLPVTVIDAHYQGDKARTALRVQAVALWLLAGLVGITALVVIGQLVWRQRVGEASDNTRLAALGMSRGQRTALGMTGAVVVALGAGVVAVVVALVASPFFPTGLAAKAEPHPGLDLDVEVVGLGFLLTVVALCSLAAVPVWRAARLGREQRRSRNPRLPRVVGALDRLDVPVPLAVGARLGFDGQRATSAASRGGVGALAACVVALAGTLVFGASLDHLLGNPRLYGLTWDLTLTQYGDAEALQTVGVDAARSLPGVEAVAIAAIGGPGPLKIDGADARAGRHDDPTQAEVLAIEVRKGSLAPPVLEGRAPRGPDEIVLSTKTFEAVRARVGSTVSAAFEGAVARRFQVVGRAAIPVFFNTSSSGSAAWVDLEGAKALLAGFPGFEEGEGADLVGDALMLGLAPGTDRAGTVAALNRELARRCSQRPDACPESGFDLGPLTVNDPDDIVNFGRVQQAPSIAGIVLAVLAVGTLSLVVATTVRRRRRDLVMLKSLGMTRRGVAASVMVQAVLAMGVALTVGVPLGIVAGRAAWSWRAADLGIVYEPRVPVALLLTVAAAGLVGALSVAAVPAQVAARARISDALRVE